MDWTNVGRVYGIKHTRHVSVIRKFTYTLCKRVKLSIYISVSACVKPCKLIFNHAKLDKCKCK
jgi:hypothetical protein